MFKERTVLRLRKLDDLINKGIIDKIGDLLIDRNNECYITSDIVKRFNSEDRLVQIKSKACRINNSFLSEDDITYYEDWFEEYPIEGRYVCLKKSEDNNFYKVMECQDLYTIILENGCIYNTKDIDFDTKKFNKGDKIKLKDNAKINNVYNGVTLFKNIMFNTGTVIECDFDNTVLVETDEGKYWYGIDCIEKYEDDKKNEKTFNKLNDNPLKIVKKRYYFGDEETTIKIIPNQRTLKLAIKRSKEIGDIVWFDNADKVEHGFALNINETKQLIEYLTKLVNVIENSIEDEMKF